jgi:catechol 2,3-dioxygenase-like lactoylglutathione lyase family enzyme
MSIAKYAYTALDCPDPIALAEFYSNITGWPVQPLGDSKPEDVTWLELLDENGATRMGFQKIENYQRPTWPDGPVPQQLHLDFHVTDMEKARKELLAIGAVQAEYQSADHFQVFYDPDGHPFCLVLKEVL